MIVWRGLGIFVPIIPAAIWLFVPGLFKSTLPETVYTAYFKYISSFSLLLGALVLWFFGRKLNAIESRTVVDEDSGKKKVRMARHSLFFINMEYWAIPLFLLFLIVVIG